MSLPDTKLGRPGIPLETRRLAVEMYTNGLSPRHVMKACNLTQTVAYELQRFAIWLGEYRDEWEADRA